MSLVGVLWILCGLKSCRVPQLLAELVLPIKFTVVPIVLPSSSKRRTLSVVRTSDLVSLQPLSWAPQSCQMVFTSKRGERSQRYLLARFARPRSAPLSWKGLNAPRRAALPA